MTIDFLIVNPSYVNIWYPKYLAKYKKQRGHDHVRVLYSKNLVITYTYFLQPLITYGPVLPTFCIKSKRSQRNTKTETVSLLEPFLIAIICNNEDSHYHVRGILQPQQTQQTTPQGALPPSPNRGPYKWNGAGPSPGHRP